MYSTLSLLLAASPAVWAAPKPQAGIFPSCSLITFFKNGCTQPPPPSPPQKNGPGDWWLEKLPSTCFNIQSALTASDGSPLFLTVDFAGYKQIGFTTVAKPITNWTNYTMKTVNGQQLPFGSTQKFCARNQGSRTWLSPDQIASVIVNFAQEIEGLSMLGYLAYAGNSQKSSANPFNTLPLPGGPNSTDIWTTLSYQSQAKGWFVMTATNWPLVPNSGTYAFLDVSPTVLAQDRRETLITVSDSAVNPPLSQTWTVNVLNNIDTSQYYW